VSNTFEAPTAKAVSLRQLPTEIATMPLPGVNACGRPASAMAAAVPESELRFNVSMRWLSAPSPACIWPKVATSLGPRFVT